MRIDHYLQSLPPDTGEHSDPELLRVLDGRPDTTTAARVWAAIADGSASVEDTLAWAQHVAREIQANVIDGAERDAAPAALRAIGFYGRVDVYRSAREYLETVATFEVLDEHGVPVRLARQPASAWLKLLRSAGHLLDVTDKTAHNQINAWRKELGIE
ncbi:MAG: hypothetical protein QE290_19145 [Acidovorax sp.]|uniref:hypothetical protein n=1 Tax=Acidovorax sp. TaxID=1872122 RepID=UPI002616D9F3|nr:hypothetical protein [Acidovorax sp.]MDH4466149.1 hypothetical protein [Acidovorax sp.]